MIVFGLVEIFCAQIIAALGHGLYFPWSALTNRRPALWWRQADHNR